MAGHVPVSSSLQDIYTEDAILHQGKRWDKLVAQFEKQFGNAPFFVARSPGRVNIIGEHIDYSLYEVLPMAITADAIIAVRATPAESSSFKIKVANIQPERFPTREFDIDTHGAVDIDSKVHEWTNYFKAGLSGALELLRKKYGKDFKPVNMEVLMDGTVPAGGGLSSSAAFVSASALSVMYANGEKDVDKTELTELAIVSERAVGVNSGGMDQSASVLSLRGSALYVSFKPTLTARAVQFPQTDPPLSFVIAQSFVAADKHVTGPVCYNLRVVECSLAAAYLYAKHVSTTIPLAADSGPLKISLRGFHDAYFASTSKPFAEQLTELEALVKETFPKEEGYTREEIAEVLGMSVTDLEARFTSTFPIRAEKFLLRQRALHVFSEASRVLAFMHLLEHPLSTIAPTRAPKNLNQALGDLMNETQKSCRELYDCSCPELDELCTIALANGAYGSRLTGAGWGGCSVHIVPTDRVEDVKAAWEKEYYSKRDLTAEQREGAVVVSKPGGGSAVYLV